MMPPKQWLMLWLVFLGYLFLGASLFFVIESKHEQVRRLEDPSQLTVEELLMRYYTWSSTKAHKLLLLKLRDYCNHTVFTPEGLKTIEKIEEMEEPFDWTFFNAYFFALTTLSTIGYGNLHPTSTVGRMLLIVYSLIGIPLNGIVLSQLAQLFSSTFLRVQQRYKGKRFETRFMLLVDIIMYLIPGILLFVFLPSGFFVYFEGWTFEESVYFAYVTLTTIGYGDYIAGQQTQSIVWFYMYRIGLFVWIMFGLGYLVMILGFISQAMQCKKMARLERKLVEKVWNEFTRDFSYLRRMLNEVYLLKFKPIYQNEKLQSELQQRSRSQSAPNLSEWPKLMRIVKPVEPSSSDDEQHTLAQFEKVRLRRRRGLHENLFKHNQLRVRSESDLSKIDKTATFSNVSNIEKCQLLARAVDAFENTYSRSRSTSTSTSTSSSSLNFSSANEDEDDKQPQKKMSKFEKELYCVSGFTSEEILSSELHEQPIGGEWDVVKNSSTYFQKIPTSYSEQWTWPSAESTIKKIPPSLTMRSDQRLHSIPQDAASKTTTIQLPGVQSIRRMSAAALNFLSSSKLAGKMATAREVTAATVADGSKVRRTGRTACPRKNTKKRYSLCNMEYDSMCQHINYFTQIKMKESNIINMLKNQIGNLENSSTVGPILEQTSIGDFLRIVNSLHSTSDYYKTSASEAHDVERSSPLWTLFHDNTKENPPNERRCSTTPRRYSLAPPTATSNCPKISRNNSFSTNASPAACKISPSPSVAPQTPTRSNPALSVPQIRRIRCESATSAQQLGGETVTTITTATSSAPSAAISANVGALGIRKIRRFSVKPVSLGPPLTPQIVVDQSHNIDHLTSTDLQVRADVTLESLRIEK